MAFYSRFYCTFTTPCKVDIFIFVHYLNIFLQFASHSFSIYITSLLLYSTVCYIRDSLSFVSVFPLHISLQPLVSFLKSCSSSFRRLVQRFQDMFTLTPTLNIPPVLFPHIHSLYWLYIRRFMHFPSPFYLDISTI